MVLVPEKESAVVKSLLETLPPVGEGATAAAVWRDGARIQCLMRISADEIRGLAVGVQTATGYFVMRGISAAECGDDDDDDDDD